jgi:orotidine-5'-phosphate decarboxylase
MFNIHALGGREMMKQTVAEVRASCERESLSRPLVIAVTVVTSADQETLREIGIERELETEVVELALLAADCGLDGVVASPHEVRIVKNAVAKNDFLVVTPGIRADFATGDDQKRVTTFRGALASGSDYVVIGRPILQAADRSKAVRNIIEEVGAADQ